MSPFQSQSGDQVRSVQASHLLLYYQHRLAMLVVSGLVCINNKLPLLRPRPNRSNSNRSSSNNDRMLWVDTKDNHHNSGQGDLIHQGENEYWGPKRGADQRRRWESLKAAAIGIGGSVKSMKPVTSKFG